LEEIIFENFNISENNIISVELAKVLRYLDDHCKRGKNSVRIFRIGGNLHCFSSYAPPPKLGQVFYHGEG
jgi:hypothetical protein